MGTTKCKLSAKEIKNIAANIHLTYWTCDQDVAEVVTEVLTRNFGPKMEDRWNWIYLEDGDHHDPITTVNKYNTKEECQSCLSSNDVVLCKIESTKESFEVEDED